jgi:hypothetical protein
MAARKSHLLWMTLFAIAMAQVEASLVVHPRSVYYPDDALNLFPLALLSHRDLALELIREAATVIMLLSVALIAEPEFQREVQHPRPAMMAGWLSRPEGVLPCHRIHTFPATKGRKFPY